MEGRTSIPRSFASCFSDSARASSPVFRTLPAMISRILEAPRRYCGAASKKARRACSWTWCSFSGLRRNQLGPGKERGTDAPELSDAEDEVLSHLEWESSEGERVARRVDDLGDLEPLLPAHHVLPTHLLLRGGSTIPQASRNVLCNNERLDSDFLLIRVVPPAEGSEKTVDVTLSPSGVDHENVGLAEAERVELGKDEVVAVLAGSGLRGKRRGRDGQEFEVGKDVAACDGGGVGVACLATLDAAKHVGAARMCEGCAGKNERRGGPDGWVVSVAAYWDPAQLPNDRVGERVAHRICSCSSVQFAEVERTTSPIQMSGTRPLRSPSRVRKILPML